MVVSGDGKQLELNGAGWALGPPLKHGQTTLIMELGKAVRPLDFLRMMSIYSMCNFPHICTCVLSIQDSQPCKPGMSPLHDHLDLFASLISLPFRSVLCPQGCNLESLWWGVCVLDKATDEAGNLDPGTSINAGNSPFIVRKEGTLYTHGRSDRYESLFLDAASQALVSHAARIPGCCCCCCC